MKKILWLSALALVAAVVPSIVRAAQNEKKHDEVIVTTTLESVR